ncbi:PaaI family thioesterase [Amylibacter sp. SFDW26]|uniref:PaaI family thioesterase n=1 Tax=Amylibacter sp. SFDW26 TaxID=2652722 RepID=UPI0012619225|nr:PaaI family thioesterase [Amylibacter sp. SFDW26]KAB7613664.1 PaaI family thioesterase [Amylibacter sp. SFDW26]
MREKPEPIQVIKTRRDGALLRLVDAIPYIKFMGISFERRGDELTGTMAYSDMLIGNPTLPAIHGGATAAFLETTAIIELAWSELWGKIETEKLSGAEIEELPLPILPKTIDFTTDYLAAGKPRDIYTRARINRSGRRYASVHVEAWQDNRQKIIGQATGHFLMPSKDA